MRLARRIAAVAVSMIAASSLTVTSFASIDSKYYSVEDTKDSSGNVTHEKGTLKIDVYSFASDNNVSLSDIYGISMGVNGDMSAGYGGSVVVWSDANWWDASTFGSFGNYGVTGQKYNMDEDNVLTLVSDSALFANAAYAAGLTVQRYWGNIADSFDIKILDKDGNELAGVDPADTALYVINYNGSPVDYNVPLDSVTDVTAIDKIVATIQSGKYANGTIGYNNSNGTWTTPVNQFETNGGIVTWEASVGGDIKDGLKLQVFWVNDNGTVYVQSVDLYDSKGSLIKTFDKANPPTSNPADDETPDVVVDDGGTTDDKTDDTTDDKTDDKTDDTTDDKTDDKTDDTTDDKTDDKTDNTTDDKTDDTTDTNTQTDDTTTEPEDSGDAVDVVDVDDTADVVADDDNTPDETPADTTAPDETPADTPAPAENTEKSTKGGREIDVRTRDDYNIISDGDTVVPAQGGGAAVTPAASSSETTAVSDADKTASGDTDTDKTASGDSDAEKTDSGDTGADATASDTDAGSDGGAADVGNVISDLIADAGEGEVEIDLSEYDEGDGLVISADLFAEISGSDTVIAITAGDYTVYIIPDNITDARSINVAMNVEPATTSTDLNGVAVPAGSVIIEPFQKGEFGAALDVNIPAESLGDIDPAAAKLYYISDSGEIELQEGAIKVNEDGSVTITLTHASAYVITDEDLIAEEEADTADNDVEAVSETGKSDTDVVVISGSPEAGDSNPATGAGLSVSAVLAALGLGFLSRKRK